MTSSQTALMSISPARAAATSSFAGFAFGSLRWRFQPRARRMIKSDAFLLAKLGEISARTRHGEVATALTVAAFPDCAKVQVSAASC
jgi:hypothetical protein